MLRNPFDSLGKRGVRDLWNTPLLTHLYQKYNIRYRYMGLPGIDLLDVKQWKEMIEHVIAFETRAEPTLTDPQGRSRITELRRQLKLLNIPGYAYFGPLEEVVIIGKDYDGTDYSQGHVITLYNLDFCDEISSRISTSTQGEQVWRFEAIRHILREQRDYFQTYGGPRYFIVLLTVRNQISINKLRDYLSSNIYDDTRDYLSTCGGIDALPNNVEYVLGTDSWALKMFMHNSLRQYMINPHISALFFPIVKYTGTPIVRTGQLIVTSPMIHFMILCKFDEVQSPSPSFMPTGFLKEAVSIRAVDQHVIVWEPETGEAGPCKGRVDCVEWFSNFETGFF